jgi:hypothetical protein
VTVFRVFVKGSGFNLAIDGEDRRCGFYKNEYVRARDANSAADLARDRIIARVAKHPSIKRTRDGAIALAIEEIETAPLWSLFRREGFIFFPEEEGS